MENITMFISWHICYFFVISFSSFNVFSLFFERLNRKIEQIIADILVFHS